MDYPPGYRPLTIDYDYWTDIVRIEGIRYAGEFFRSFSPGGLPVGATFRIVLRDHDTVAIEQVKSE